MGAVFVTIIFAKENLYVRISGTMTWADFLTFLNEHKVFGCLQTLARHLGPSKYNCNRLTESKIPIIVS